MKKYAIRLISLCFLCLFAFGICAESVGDVNGDGACTVVDALLLLRSILNDTALDSADLTGDGKVTLADVLRVLKLSTADDQAEFRTKFANTDKYIYRIGNANAVTLGDLFSAIGTVEDVTVTVRKLQAETDATCVYTPNADNWTKGTLSFSGTGPVEVTVTDGTGACALLLEVVDAKNIRTYSELVNGNCVLLGDITMASGRTYYLSNATLYGNGFTFDVSAGANTGGSLSSNYLISLVNATLDNVQIIGEVYTEYGIQTKDPYNNPVILSTGTSTVAGCYIANCASPIRVNGGALTVTDTILSGGNFANLDIRNGNVVLENVVTINQSSANDLAADGSVSVGLGIVIYYENVLDTTTLTIRGELTQYNYISDNDVFTNIYAGDLVAEMLSSSHTELQLELDGVTYANAGIVSMSEGMEDNIFDERTDSNYVGKTVYFYSVDGYVYTVIPTAESIFETAPDFTPSAQYAISPAYRFDFTSKNYLPKADGSNDFCYADNGTVRISMDEGDTFFFDPAILSVEKNGRTLPYTVSINGIDCTDSAIPFDTVGNYTLLYTYTDPDNYALDENGDLTAYDKTYTKELPISVSVVKSDAKNASFTFGSDGIAAETVTVGNNTYVSAVAVTADDTAWSYTTVSGQKIYYPIVDVTFEDAGTNFWAHFPVFDGVITITDYADGGVGDAFVYDASTLTLPDTLTVTKGVYKARANVTNWYNLTDAQLTQIGANKVFKYASASDAADTPSVYNGVLSYRSPQISATRDAYMTLAQYSYTDAAGATYLYYVGYNIPQHNRPGGCVTPDTLVTMADGSAKRIDAVSADELLRVWDFRSGAYAAAPAAILFDHGYGENTVIALTFDDQTVLRLVNLHQLFDADLNRFVTVTAKNAESLIGHRFIRQSGDGYTAVTLTDCSVTREYTGAYGIISAQHYNILVEGMLSTDFMEEDFGLFNYFTIGKDLRFDEAQMQADIETYGLYTYADFANVLTEEQFLAFGCPYMKVAVGKGQYTFEQILALINTYLQ